ncbi:MAG: hypothetical protein J2P59_01180 [Acidimicrobiales bacterium]|nr:hypothetical protein [Acidimicrobiales bacterium]
MARHLARLLGDRRRSALSSQNLSVARMERSVAEQVTDGQGTTLRRTLFWESVELLTSDERPAPTPAHRRLSSRKRVPSGTPRLLGPRARTLAGLGGAVVGLVASRRALQGLPSGGVRPRAVGAGPRRALPVPSSQRPSG